MMATLTATAPAPTFNVTHYLNQLSSAAHLLRIQMAAVELAAEIASPDFEGWADFWASPDAVLDTMVINHTYAQWRIDARPDEPTQRDLDAVRAVWRLAYLAQAADFDEVMA